MNGRPSPHPPARAGLSSEWFRIILMGVFLAVLIFVFFFDGLGGETTSNERAMLAPTLPPAAVYTPDPEILAEAKDSTRRDRLLRDERPFQHLLEKSLAVVPDIARALNIPAQPIPVARLRADPDRFRGRYLWYKGILESLSPGKPGHPVRGYEIHEGRLRTESGDQVLFAFSLPPPEGLQIGKDWVRIEGFFLKLRDDHFPVIEQAPLLVGLELTRALPDWQAVETLDPQVLGRVRDGAMAGGVVVDQQDMGATLAESQDVPLWHLASYAMHQHLTRADADVEALPAFTDVAQWRELEAGDVPRGTAYRLLGTFQLGRTIAARDNPLGLDGWSEVWIQSRDLAGRTIPIWLPKRLGDEWRRNQTVKLVGYFFKRYVYESQNGERHYAPVFVAADLTRFSLSRNLLNNGITWTFAGIVALVGVAFFAMARRDRRRRLQHEQDLVDRRRRRRDVTPAGQHA